MRQTLDNYDDSMYIANISVGGQTIKGVLDTGSFELVIFGQNCRTCGIARAYDETNSTTYKGGFEQKELSYGSGTCVTTEGRDTVVTAGLQAQNQAFWLAYECQMPLLWNAPFQAIVGIGPPGQPLFLAEESLDHMTEADAPFDLIMEAKHQVYIAKTRTDLTKKLGVSVFSTCLGREVGSPGYLIWNDVRPIERPGMVTAHVPGKITWSVEVKGGSFKSPLGFGMVEVACKNGCGAIVDTGTTLLGLDTVSYNSVFRYISQMNRDCSDLSVYPSLHFKVGDGEIVLPPSAFIAEVYGLASDTLGTLIHMNRPSAFQNASRLYETGAPVMCQLMIMDMGTLETPFGPEIIMGMSTFREYYVTFDLGTGRDDRSIFFSPANDQCDPMSAEEIELQGDRARHIGLRNPGSTLIRPRRIDISKVRLPKKFDGKI